jgi:hypothetical protein
MKLFKITSIALFAAFSALFIYANVRGLSITEQLDPIHLVSFDLKYELSSDEETMLERRISTTPGVTACTIHDHTASVTFHPQVIDEVTLSLLLEDGKSSVSRKEFATAAKGCPVHELAFSFNQFISTLDLRN